MNSNNLKRMLQVSMSEVWVKDKVSDTAYFPESDGSFNPLDVPENTTLAVQGPNSAVYPILPCRTNTVQ